MNERMNEAVLKDLAAALGRVPSGLFIMTVGDGPHAIGMLVSLVQQCSFDPPQISVAVRRDRNISALLTDDAPFVLNQIAADQSNLLRHFGKGVTPGEPAFNGLQTSASSLGVPVLMDALCHLDCRVTGRFPAGDHDLVIGRVVAGRLHSELGPYVHIRKNGLNY